ncbi:MAG: flavodoxin [Herbinix sp.]|nr:flavodoxin [Herbinix sp.]
MLKAEKTVVVYRSKTGFTKNYACWLAKRFNCTLLEGSKVSGKELSDYDTIIYGGGLYASGISGIKLITKNFEQLKDKRIIVFAVGASPSHKGIAEELLNTNIPREQQDKIEFFYLRGGFDYTRLSPFYRVLMQLKKIQLKKVKKPDADTKGMLASYDHPLDFTNEKHLEPIIKSLLE